MQSEIHILERAMCAKRYGASDSIFFNQVNYKPMKKIYTLLVAAGVAASAFALPAPQKANLKLSEPLDMEKALQQKPIVSYALDAKDGQMRIVDKNTDKSWSMMIGIMGVWPLSYEEPDGTVTPATIEDFPYYQSMISFQPDDSSDPGMYPLWFSWPATAALDDDCWSVDEASQSSYFDADKVREKYGEDGFKPMPYETLVETWQLKTKFFTLPGWYYTPGLVGAEGAGQNYMVTCADGVNRYLKSAILEDNAWNYTESTTIDFTAYDKDASSVDLLFDGKFTSTFPTANGRVEATLNCDFSGDAVVLGLNDIFWDTIGQIHIFNGGREDGASDWSLNYPEWGSPLNFYYLAFCDNTFAYRGFTSDNEEVACYTDTELPSTQFSNGVNYGAPSFPLVEDAHLNFFAGTIWAPENAENPYGIWTLKEPTIDPDDPTSYYQIPEAYNLIAYGGDDPASYIEGFHGTYEGYTQIPVPEKTFIAIGDKELGLNFNIETSTNYGHSIQGYSTNEIFYHGTPNQWMQFEMIPSTSDASYNVLTASVTAVESEAPVVSRSFYNFQGQRLNSEPENGMYIIRSVKADGTVKAVKVAK